jgi:uncharacterized protein (TIGR00255 family)
MTGFGTATAPLGNIALSVEIRSVNHRFFSPAIKLPSALTRWEGDVREAVRKRVSRGHVSISARLESAVTTATSSINARAFAAAVADLRALHAEHQLAGAVDLATVMRMPGLLSGGSEEVVIDDPAAVLAVVDEAVSALLAMRVAEGARLGEIIAERLAVAEEIMERIALRGPARVVAHRDRLRANIQELLQGVAIDEQRLAQEVSFTAERWDIGEEIDRFRSHCLAFRETLTTVTGEPVGKRLGFLLQELLREANTTGSKANEADMQRDVVAIKEELERIREQVENLE